MSKNENAFWLVFASGMLSIFLGAIVGFIFYPTSRQFLGDHAKFAVFIIWIGFSVALFMLLRFLILRLIRNG